MVPIILNVMINVAGVKMHFRRVISQKAKKTLSQ